MHYANLNSSSINKKFSNYGPLNMLFLAFRFLIYVSFNEALFKKFIKKLSFFNTNFQDLFQDVVYYRILWLWYKNSRTLNIKQNLNKMASFQNRYFQHIFKNCTKKCLKIYKPIVIQNFKSVPLCPIKWQPLKIFCEITSFNSRYS